MKQLFIFLTIALLFAACGKEGGVTPTVDPPESEELNIEVEQLETIKFSVASTYDHDNQLHRFGYFFYLPNREIFSWGSPLWDDDKFSQTTDRLTPGSWSVDLYEVTNTATAEAIVEFVKSKGGLFVSAQGISELCWRAYEDLPKGQILGVEKEESLLPKYGTSVGSMAYLLRIKEGEDMTNAFALDQIPWIGLGDSKFGGFIVPIFKKL